LIRGVAGDRGVKISATSSCAIAADALNANAQTHAVIRNRFISFSAEPDRPMTQTLRRCLALYRSKAAALN
jgi:hypothetical protein